MRELSPAGRLAAWGNAALSGAVSPDEAADRVTGPTDTPHLHYQNHTLFN